MVYSYSFLYYAAIASNILKLIFTIAIRLLDYLFLFSGYNCYVSVFVVGF